jgi:23S rRNA U2552 (ribose-2'-O)-methylase RlmE/FtsJ
MTYYLLPKTSINIHDNISIFADYDPPDIFLSFSLSDYLSKMKEKIDNFSNDWDNIKKYTNPYEFIHTNIPNKNKCVAKYKPLSRSYFKMIEILNLLKINYSTQSPISTFHLAEGPGGFIEAISNLRKNPNDKYIGMTLIDDNNTNIPGWKKTLNFLNKHTNVFIEKGHTQDGDLLNIDNFNFCFHKYAHSMEIITADGGFDFSHDFNKQETNIAQLLFAQIAYAIIMQKENGCFILKIFDSFMQHTVDLLAILSSFYDKVYIVKPNTSRYANSEKYIVCKYFIFNGNINYYYNLFLKPFSQMIHADDRFIKRFLKIDTSMYFLTKLQEYNAIFGQQQLENIYHTFTLIQNKNKFDKSSNNIKNNIIKCINWCNKYNVDALPQELLID